MLKELYSCDRVGCKNTTEADGRGEFFYSDPSWIGVKIGGVDKIAKDFCSFECLGLWVDAQIKEIRGGKQ